MADEILIGTEGWRHAAWRGDFYPEELPVDWEFCYYSNRLRAVWLPVAAAEADSAEIGEWLRDSDPAFRFVLSVAAERAHIDAWRRAFCARMAPLQTRVAGIALTDPTSLASSDLAGAIVALRAFAPVCVDAPPTASVASGDLGLITCVWDADSASLPPWSGSASAGPCLARMTGGHPRAIRHTLEQLAAAPATTAGLFFRTGVDAPAAAPHRAEAARTLAELLGL